MPQKPTYEALEKRVRELENVEIELRQKEKSIQESEKRLRAIIDAAPFGAHVYQLSNDGNLLFSGFNSAAEKILNVDHHQFLGKSIIEAFPDLSKTPIPKAYHQVALTGEPHFTQQINYEEQNIKGAYEVSAVNIGGKQMVAFFRDITESARAEERQKLLARMLEEAPIYITVHDSEGRFLFANRSAYTMHGYTLEEFMSKRILDLNAFANRNQIKKRLFQIERDGQIRFETVHVRKNGSTFPLEVHLKGIDWHGRKAVLSICSDLTERKREEQYNRMLVEMLDAAPNSIVVLDPDMGFLYANRTTFEMHGYDKDEFMSLTISDVDVPESKELLQERIKTVLEKGEASFTVEHYRKDGSVLPMRVYAKKVNWEGKPAFLNIATDITESKEAERKRKALEDQLNQAQKIEAIGRLAGGVAHDFNNMLSLIIGHADMALRHVEPSQPLYNNLYEIRKAGERSADLTRQLLAFARKQTISPKKLDLNKTVEGMLQMLRRLIGEDIELIWKAGKDLWPVKVDPSQIDQILANLCVNSRDAIENTGRIIIETANVVFDDFYCKEHLGFEPGEYAQLIVSDNGSGMDAETLGNIFVPFFTTKELGKGTGLGLATIYGVVKQNNGFINVYSEPGRGTTFKIYLPRLQPSTADVTEKVESKPFLDGNETVLIVEDEPAILKMSKMMLETLGYSVVSARTPGEAIRISQAFSGPIDLLLTDVIMPEMNGRDLAKELTSLFPNLSVLYMSGYTANVIAHHGVLDEGVHFIQKPFSRKILGAKIREVLDGRCL